MHVSGDDGHITRNLLRGLLISDFNIENLAAMLRKPTNGRTLEVESAPFGQVESLLRNEEFTASLAPLGFTLIWTRPEAVLPTFRDALEGKAITTGMLDEDVDNFADGILGAAHPTRVTFVIDWALAPFHPGQGMRGLYGSGMVQLLLRANHRLLERLQDASSCIVLYSAKWFQTVGEKAFNPRLWYSAKIPFANELFKEAAADIRTALLGLAGENRKLLILDLDDTLWGGIVGDIGWDQLQLGGHDPSGEAFSDFQRHLRSLSRRGLILGLVSKNDEQVALEAIRSHPEMILRLEDFAGWRINWIDKAENIRALTAELNLGLDHVVFIDDNPVERGRVREALPDVLVPEWPADPRLYVQALLRLDCFDYSASTPEDRMRSSAYAAERSRSDLKNQVSSMEDWLHTLELKVTIEPLAPSNLSRAAQLLNKTNQFNLSTRRLTETEFAEWASQADRLVWTVRVSDRFGDSGLTGLISAEQVGEDAIIRDFILSCRVFGRKIEDAMLGIVWDWASATNLSRIVAEYIPTAKNKPCLEFLQRSGAASQGPHRFYWNSTARPCGGAPHITIIRPEDEESPCPTQLYQRSGRE